MTSGGGDGQGHLLFIGPGRPHGPEHAVRLPDEHACGQEGAEAIVGNTVALGPSEREDSEARLGQGQHIASV